MILKRNKELELKIFKQQHDEEVRKLNQEIQSLNKKLFDSRKEERKKMVASVIPQSNIDKNKLIDSARTSRIKD